MTSSAAGSTGSGTDPATGSLPMLPMPRRPRPLEARDLRWLTELQYLAVQHMERTGCEAYRLELTEVHGRVVPHYHFDDGYHTTSEDAAVTHLRVILANLGRPCE